MGVVYLLIMIAALALVIGWYLMNEAANAEGDKGLLAAKLEEADVEPALGGRHYRFKQRRAPKQRNLRHDDEGEASFKTPSGAPKYANRVDAAYVERGSEYAKNRNDKSED